MSDEVDEGAAPAQPTQQGIPAPKVVDSLLGATVATYKIRRPIGGGGMGTAYLARQRSGAIDRPVVLKFLHPELIGSEEAMRRFEREAAILGKLSFPSVQVYEHGAYEGRPYLAMEYIHGITLGKFKDQNYPGVPLPSWLAVLIICLAGRGLKAAHAQKVVHRDVKADNIMLTVSPDGRLQVRIIDYGIGKTSGSMRRAVESGNTTQLGLILGTPDHMSPEQAVGDPIDARTDQYSLAIMAYELLVGKVPFEADAGADDEMRSLFVKILTAPVPPFESSSVPPGVEECVVKALSKKRDNRFPDILDFVNALHEASGVDLDKVSLLDPEMLSLIKPLAEVDEEEALPQAVSSGRDPTVGDGVVAVGDTEQRRLGARRRERFVFVVMGVVGVLSFIGGLALMLSRGPAPSRRATDAGTTVTARPTADASTFAPPTPLVVHDAPVSTDASAPPSVITPDASIAEAAVTVADSAVVEAGTAAVVRRTVSPRCPRDERCSSPRDNPSVQPVGRRGRSCMAECVRGCWVCQR